MDKVLSSLRSNQNFAFKVNYLQTQLLFEETPFRQGVPVYFDQGRKEGWCYCPKYVRMDQNSFLNFAVWKFPSY